MLSKVFSNKAFIENKDLQQELVKIIDTTDSKEKSEERIKVLDSYLCSKGTVFEERLGEFVLNGWECRY